jgi:hypothetical protein
LLWFSTLWLSHKLLRSYLGRSELQTALAGGVGKCFYTAMVSEA